jgi:uncharacterized membrane protein YphA (DoxX/SURF4 family)
MARCEVCGNDYDKAFEYHLLVLAIVLALLVRGGGAWSVDRALTLRRAAGGAAGA